MTPSSCGIGEAVAVPKFYLRQLDVCVIYTQTKPPIKLMLYLTICRIYTHDLWVTPSVGKVFHFLSKRREEDQPIFRTSHVQIFWSFLPTDPLKQRGSFDIEGYFLHSQKLSPLPPVG